MFQRINWHEIWSRQSWLSDDLRRSPEFSSRATEKLNFVVFKDIFDNYGVIFCTDLNVLLMMDSKNLVIF